MWECAEGVNRIDWLNSPYRFPKFSVAFETRAFLRDTPTLFVGWQSEAMRRVCRLAGWMHLVATGRVPSGTAMPLAPLLMRVMVSSGHEGAVLLVQKFCLLFHHAELDTPTARELWLGAWVPLLESSEPSNELFLLLARAAASHSLRCREVEALVPLLMREKEDPQFKPLRALTDDLKRLAAKHFATDCFALDNDLRTRLLCAVCTSKNQSAVVAWVNANWRTITRVPCEAVFQITQDVCWSEPAGVSRVAEYIRREVPYTLVKAACALAHSVETRALPTFAKLSSVFGLQLDWEGHAANDGFTTLPASTTHAFLECVIAKPEPTRSALAIKISAHWRPADPPSSTPAPWAVCASPSTSWAEVPNEFLASAERIAAHWKPHTILNVFTFLEREARGTRCRWAGLTPSYAMCALSFPLARDQGTWLWPDYNMPLLVDTNADPVAGPFFREAMRRPFSLSCVQLNPVSPPALGHGNMDIEAALDSSNKRHHE